MDTLIASVIKPEIRALQRIKDTFDERFEYLRLDKNERLLPFPEELLADFRSSIESDDLMGYAELGRTYKNLAQYLGVQDSQLLLAHGSDIAIKSVFEAIVGKGDSIVLHAPSYAMYRVYAAMFNAEARLVPVKADWQVDIETMLGQVDSTTKMLVLENPNGFIGTQPSLEDITYCAKELGKKDVVLVLDEAYFYVENTAFDKAELVQTHKNVIISQTFSKAHGLAGLRMGYLVGHPDIMEYISRVRPMHEITSLTAKASNWIMENPNILEDFQGSIKESKDYLKRELALLNIGYRDTSANFVLLYFPEEGRTADMTKKLRDKHILIRRPFQEEALRGWSRVCVGSMEDSKRLLKGIHEALESDNG